MLLSIAAILLPSYAHANGSESEPALQDVEFVVDNQPRLHIDPTDVQHNKIPLEIRYYINRIASTTYITYIYIWEFSNTAWWAELLGYSDHSWDYEPVIVRIDNQLGDIKYIYDRGHYIAGITNNSNLTVTKGSHGFSPTDSTGGRLFPADTFNQLILEELSEMNEKIEPLHRLPFGQKLSLDWAYYNPAKVEQKGAFSTDNGFASIPAQTNAFAGIIVGIFITILIKALTLITTRFPPVKLLPTGIICISLGSAGGILSGVITPLVQNATESHVLGTLTGLLSVTIISLLLSMVLVVAYKRELLTLLILFGGLSGAFSGCLTSIW